MFPKWASTTSSRQSARVTLLWSSWPITQSPNPMWVVQLRLISRKNFKANRCKWWRLVSDARQMCWRLWLFCSNGKTSFFGNIVLVESNLICCWVLAPQGVCQQYSQNIIYAVFFGAEIWKCFDYMSVALKGECALMEVNCVLVLLKIFKLQLWFWNFPSFCSRN